ncbi:hypothetical protein [Magnetospirillum sp. UT-4]|uniref:hypothetical protein n=1 Tax=Magnetospirillum sp. UT-4 TaxID=2681467 RepID=UPI0015737F82|nr:hypothetical protein [Magnetospirillum sp. UT-4]
MLTPDIERRYDGPVPPADPAHPAIPPAAARIRLFDRLAAEARAGAARCRLVRDCGADRHAGALACYRAHAVAWRGMGPGSPVTAAPARWER